jgi:hypothetical protein
VIALVTVVAAISISATNPSSTSTVTQFPSGNGGPDTVNVTEVVVNVPTDACGLSGITPGAFSVPAGTNYPIGWWLPWSGGSVPCSVSNVSSDTAGFSIWGNFPLNVTSPGTPLMFTIACPAAYTGVLTLTVL